MDVLDDDEVDSEEEAERIAEKEVDRIIDKLDWDINDRDYYTYILHPHSPPPEIEHYIDFDQEIPSPDSSTILKYYADKNAEKSTQRRDKLGGESVTSKAKTIYEEKDSGEDGPCTYDILDERVIQGLIGMSMLSSNLAVIEEEKILFRKDHNTMTNKVKLISGGAAGYDPLFSSYVGYGLLTAAVYGNITGAPTPKQILTALRELNTPSGIIMIIKNELPDRLSFGLAMERARAEGILVDMVTVGDDCFEQQRNKVGRRCLAGIVAVIKVAGAMSEYGKSMTDIYLMCRGMIITSLSTVIPIDSYAKMGTDLKGNGGKILREMSVHDIVKKMFGYMIDKKQYLSASIYPENGFVILLNIYRVDPLLLGFLIRKLQEELKKAHICIERYYPSSFISGPVPGFSITLVKDFGRELVPFFDVPVPCKIWPECVISMPVLRTKTLIGALPFAPATGCKETGLKGPLSDDYFKRYCESCINEACRKVISEQFQLNRMDPSGHFGSAISKGAREVLRDMTCKRLDYKRPFHLMSQISNTLEESITSEIGITYALLFIGIAQYLLSFASSITININVWIEALKNGINTVSSMLHVKAGQCTLLEALLPFHKKMLKEDIRKTFIERIGEAVEAAEVGVETTTYMKSNRHNPDLPEPGAYTVGLVLRAIYDTAKKLYDHDVACQRDETNIPCPVGTILSSSSENLYPAFIESDWESVKTK